MADEANESTPGQPGGKSQPSPPLSDRARNATADAVKDVKADITGGQHVPPTDPLPPSHTPGSQEEGDASGSKERGRSLASPPSSFKEQLEQMRREFRAIVMPEQCREDIEPESR